VKGRVDYNASAERRSFSAGGSPLTGTLAERLRLALFLAMLGICVFAGGSARPDAVQLLFLRPAILLCLVAILLVPGRLDVRVVKAPLILLGLYAASMALQLIPLPPGLWLSLPGHSRYAEAAAAAGAVQPWRPLSLTPDLTWNSLVALIVPLSALLGFAALRDDQRQVLLPVLIGIAVFSALWGMLQVLGSQSGPLYFYSVSHSGSAVGAFANRNHQALFLAMAIPALAVWARTGAGIRTTLWPRALVAVGIAIFMVPVVLVTGSRTGAVIGIVSIGAAIAIGLTSEPVRLGRVGAKWGIAVGACLAALVIATIAFGRAEAIDRLLAFNTLDSELRILNTPRVWQIMREFFPFGTGYGSFAPVFQGYELEWMLRPTYFNRAHNDLLELAMTGGAPGLLVLFAFVIWWARATLRASIPVRATSVSISFARLGAALLLLCMLASLTDYPLGTPLMVFVAAIACGWLAAYTVKRDRRQVRADVGLLPKT
jgi:O-antigen ligase